MEGERPSVTAEENILADGIIDLVAILDIERRPTHVPHDIPMDERVVRVVQDDSLLDAMLDSIAFEEA